MLIRLKGQRTEETWQANLKLLLVAQIPCQDSEGWEQTLGATEPSEHKAPFCPTETPTNNL